MANALSLLASLGSKPVGTGMAEQARQDLLGRAYRLHVEEAKSLGQTPMTPEQFAASRGNG